MSNRSYLPFPFGGLFCLLTLVACFDSEPPANAYRGPIIDAYLADPTVINDDGTYYLYATGYTKDGRGVPIYRSTNLTDWTYLGGAVPRGDSTAWNHENFWAPEVFPYAGRYYLYFTASPGTTPKNTGNRVGVAVADTPAGPFSLHGVLVPEASLDSHVYRDDDGQLYLYYVAEHGNARGLTAGRIYVDSLLSPTEVVGNPREVVGHLGWQEGPFLVREGANYLLTYSSGGWKGPKYHLRYGRADNPLGPFTEMPGRILSSNDSVKGPGHASFFRDVAGDSWIAYHGWDPGLNKRYPRLDRVRITEGTIRPVDPGYALPTRE